MAYSQTNRNGVLYHLNAKEVTLRGGRKQTIYYFTKEERPETAIYEMPKGYTTKESERTGLLVLTKER